MRIKNVSATKLILGDLLVNGYPMELGVNAEKTIFDEDAEKSLSLKNLIDSDKVTVVDENAEPVELGHGEEYAMLDMTLTSVQAVLENLIARVAALEGAS